MRKQNSKKGLSFSLLLAAQSALARLGEGYVIRVRQMGDESVLGSLGFTLERAVDQERRTYKVRHRDLTSFRQNFFTPLSLRSVISRLSEEHSIEAVEPNHLYRAFSGARRPVETKPPSDPLGDREPLLNFPELIPNDPFFFGAWGLRNRGQSIDGFRGVRGADVRATGAWVYQKGNAQTVVAVLDTGVDLEHEDLSANIWRSEEAGEALFGHNVFDPSAKPLDDHGHGTHVAGIIGAVGDNGLGVTGMNWQVSLMAVKALDAEGRGDLAGLVEGIDWAVAHGARVINASWGGASTSQIMEDAIRRAGDQGVFFVAAAGNDAMNNDRSPSFPANYSLSNLISVAALNHQNQLAEFSNYGVKKVHVAAPGESIDSTLHQNQYGAKSGTSMAAPFVSGAAALVLSHFPSMDGADLKKHLIATADRVSSLKSKIANQGVRLNALRAVGGD